MVKGPIGLDSVTSLCSSVGASSAQATRCDKFCCWVFRCCPAKGHWLSEKKWCGRRMKFIHGNFWHSELGHHHFEEVLWNCWMVHLNLLRWQTATHDPKLKLRMKPLRGKVFGSYENCWVNDRTGLFPMAWQLFQDTSYFAALEPIKQ